MPTQIKPGISAAGFRTAVRDYTELTVVEELVANSYDADASTVVVLLDSQSGILYVIDNGTGFTEESIKDIATLGGGDKQDVAYSKGKRHFLGSYGYGLKSSLNIANKVEVTSFSVDDSYNILLDWGKLDEALKSGFEGFPLHHPKKTGDQHCGTVIKLMLKSPTSKDQLDNFGAVLGNLPSDNGKFICYYGLYDHFAAELADYSKLLSDLPSKCAQLKKQGKLQIAASAILADIDQCEVQTLTDKNDETVKGTVYFAGLDGDKVRSLKPGLRGIYVRIHGRLLKENFADQEYTYNISKWIQFANGLRVEIDVDWLRDQITLSRGGIRFSNVKLASEFKGLIHRLASRFIQPHLAKLQKKKEKVLGKLQKQRLHLAEGRVAKNNDLLLPRANNNGFGFKPETDGELALLVAQKDILRAINKDFLLIDYNDKASYDAIIYDSSKMEYIYTEFEPTLMEYLGHKETDDVQMIITWTLGKWRMGAKKKGRKAFFELVGSTPKQKGYYKLLEYSSEAGKKPKKFYPVVVVEELI